jgi:hypothetical protein
MPEVPEDQRPVTSVLDELAMREVRVSDRRALALLISLVAFLVLLPVLEKNKIGSLIVVVSIYATLVTATLQIAALTGRPRRIVPTIFLAACSMAFILLSHIMPVRPLIATSQGLLIAFFTVMAVGLFVALGQPGSITKGRLYLSVSAYLILAMVWSSAYALLETLHPGSFAASSTVRGGVISRGSLFYLSLTTLTTIGSADVLPVTPIARVLAALEAATGVLYVAITIARLASAYNGRSHRPA